MVELHDIPQTAREHIQEIGAAEIVLGAIEVDSQERLDGLLQSVRLALGKLSSLSRAVVLYGPPATGRAPLTAEVADASLHALPYPLFDPDPLADPVQRMFRSYQSVLAVGENLGARACAMLASDLESVTGDWIYSLVRPVLELDFDLVTPCYAHHKFDSLLTGGIVTPFVRALYGKQILHPLGPDFGFSGRLAHRVLDTGSSGWTGARKRVAGSPVAEAICGGLEVCQVHLGPRRYPPTDWMNLSSVVAQILGPLFQEAEQNAAFWQRVRGSKPVPTFGSHTYTEEDTGAVEVRRMIESFQLGCRSLQEIWGLVLPPTTLIELRKLARPGNDSFRMPDDLWARIVYDFALGYHLKAISQDHLLRAMTPLYLAWVASYALEMESAEPSAAEERLERLSAAYEIAKPYFLSRWRWPDRFNP